MLLYKALCLQISTLTGAFSKIWLNFIDLKLKLDLTYYLYEKNVDFLMISLKIMSAYLQETKQKLPIIKS